MSWRRRLKFGCLGIVLLVLFAGFVGFPYAMSRLITTAGTRPMDLALTSSPADFDRPYEDVRFDSRDGVELSGWYLEGTTPVGIVVAHGLFRSRREVLDRAVFLNRLGAHVLTFDFRRHGTSRGETISLGYHERMDVLGAAEFLQARVDDPRLFFYGVSMGAAASVLAGRELSRSSSGIQLVGVIADSCFLSVEHTVSHHVRRIFRLPYFPFSSNLLFFLEWRASFDKDDFDLEGAIAEYGDLPVLILAGGDDWRMSPQLQRRLFDASGHPKSRFEEFAGAGHGSAYREDSAGYERVLIEFLASLAPELSGSTEEADSNRSSR